VTVNAGKNRQVVNLIFLCKLFGQGTLSMKSLQSDLKLEISDG
jgi:hypothetical protein